MAKKDNDTAIATTTATAADFGGGLQVTGRNSGGSNLSKVVLFQGTSEEEQVYGQHKRGVFLDALEVRELGEKINIMPIIAFAQWAVWEKGQRAPAQSWNDEKNVPPDLLQWTETADGHRIPPKAQMSVNVICCVNEEPWPVLFVFKRTGLKAFEKTINPLEARRGSVGKCPGLYELSSVDDKNPDGQPYKRLTARPVGEPPAAMVELAKKVFDAQQRFKQKAAEMADDNVRGDFDPDAD